MSCVPSGPVWSCVLCPEWSYVRSPDWSCVLSLEWSCVLSHESCVQCPGTPGPSCSVKPGQTSKQPISESGIIMCKQTYLDQIDAPVGQKSHYCGGPFPISCNPPFHLFYRTYTSPIYSLKYVCDYFYAFFPLKIFYFKTKSCHPV